MGIWGSLIAWYMRSRVARIVSLALAAVGGVLAYGKVQRSRGASEAKVAVTREMKDADAKRAEAIRTRVDAARSGRVRDAEDRRGYRD